MTLFYIFLGYYAYVGFILVEHVHANPVLKVFIHLLNESVKFDKIPRPTLGKQWVCLKNYASFSVLRYKGTVQISKVILERILDVFQSFVCFQLLA